MRIRFGFVAMSVMLPDCSPSHAVTLASLAGLDAAGRLYRLRQATRLNLASSLRLVRHCAGRGIEVYRFSSRLVPLATHPATAGWDWPGEFAAALAELGAEVRRTGLRVSFHPDHFCPLTSTRAEVLAAARRDYEFHRRLAAAMGLVARPLLVLHLGSAGRDRDGALRRFIEHASDLPELAAWAMLENDDRSFPPDEVLQACAATGCACVLDLHHARLLGADARLGELAGAAARTWDGRCLPPKFHLSSPRDAANPRAHADHVALGDGLAALEALRGVGRDVDVMLEAKRKDEAVLRLVGELAVAGVAADGPAAVVL